jgi:hypothetical protein
MLVLTGSNGVPSPSSGVFRVQAFHPGYAHSLPGQEGLLVARQKTATSSLFFLVSTVYLLYSMNYFLCFSTEKFCSFPAKFTNQYEFYRYYNKNLYNISWSYWRQIQIHGRYTVLLFS